MGKTNQKLTIHIPEAWKDHPKVVELREKGHVIEYLDEHEPADLILAPAAHQWSDDMWDYLEVALKAARARKYPKKKGGKK